MSDKRRCHRLKVELPVSFPSPQNKEEMVLAATMDISATGICLVTKEPLEIGQELAIQVELPTGQRPVIHVNVIRVEEMIEMVSMGGYKEYKIGFKITGPVEEDESIFVRYYAEKLKEVFEKGDA
ncbi:MAG: PilZ domain-containing protein [Candidatus Omnitrophota bacterium]